MDKGLKAAAAMVTARTTLSNTTEWQRWDAYVHVRVVNRGAAGADTCEDCKEAK